MKKISLEEFKKRLYYNEADFSNIIFEKMDLENFDLSNKDFSYSNFICVNLKGVNFEIILKFDSASDLKF